MSAEDAAAVVADAATGGSDAAAFVAGLRFSDALRSALDAAAPQLFAVFDALVLHPAP